MSSESREAMDEPRQKMAINGPVRRTDLLAL